MIAQDSGNRASETHLVANLSRLEAEYGDPLAAFNYFALAIRRYHDAGNTAMVLPFCPSLPLFSTGSDDTSRQPPLPDSLKGTPSL